MEKVLKLLKMPLFNRLYETCAGFIDDSVAYFKIWRSLRDVKKGRVKVLNSFSDLD